MAIDIALAGQGVIVVNRAFIEAELADGRLVQVMDRALQVGPQYYIFRKRSPDRRPEVDAVYGIPPTVAIEQLRLHRQRPCLKILNKAGCTDINLVELPRAMTKLEALQYLTEQGITEGDAGYAVANKLAEKAKIAKKGEVKVQASKGVKAKSTKKAVTAEEVLAAAEDAPL